MSETEKSQEVEPQQPTKDLSVIFYEPWKFHNRRVVAAYLLIKPTEENPTSTWVIGTVSCSPGMPGTYGPDQFTRKRGIKLARSRAIKTFYQTRQRIVVEHVPPFSWKQATIDLGDSLYEAGVLRVQDMLEEADLYKLKKMGSRLSRELDKFLKEVHEIVDNRVLPDGADTLGTDGLDGLDPIAEDLRYCLEFNELQDLVGNYVQV